MPWGLAEKVPSPQEEMKLPSVSQMVSGWAPLLKTWTSSAELTATSEAAPKLRLDAAKTILDRTGIIAPKAREPSTEGAMERGLGALSVHELQELAAGMEAQREAEIAKTAVPRLVGGA